MCAAKTAFSGRDWMTKDYTFKLHIVELFIHYAKNDNINIRLPASYYVHEVDKLINNSIYRGDMSGLDNSIGVALKTLAVMDGDWDNGQDKCELAKKHMGPEFFEFFRKNYPEKCKNLCGEKIIDK